MERKTEVQPRKTNNEKIYGICKRGYQTSRLEVSNAIGFQQRLLFCKDKIDNIIEAEEAIRSRWQESFEEILSSQE